MNWFICFSYMISLSSFFFLFLSLSFPYTSSPFRAFGLFCTTHFVRSCPYYLTLPLPIAICLRVSSLFDFRNDRWSFRTQNSNFTHNHHHRISNESSTLITRNPINQPKTPPLCPTHSTNGHFEPKPMSKAPEGEGCPRCGGYVYMAEQMLARGRVSWLLF